MRKANCLIMETEDFEKLLSKVTNRGVILIFDQDGWTYGSTEDYGDVNDDELYKLIGNEINETVKKIYVDDGDAIIIIE